VGKAVIGRLACNTDNIKTRNAHSMKLLYIEICSAIQKPALLRDYNCLGSAIEIIETPSNFHYGECIILRCNDVNLSFLVVEITMSDAVTPLF
tara:strand:- start:1423 stop:1701 length:279 start_codon:yes stop_codon:yes gene_type:complete